MRQNKLRNQQRKKAKEFQDSEEKSKDDSYVVDLESNQSIVIIM